MGVISTGPILRYALFAIKSTRKSGGPLRAPFGVNLRYEVVKGYA